MDFKIATMILGILIYCALIGYLAFCFFVMKFTTNVSEEYKKDKELDVATTMYVLFQVYVYIVLNPHKYLAEYFRVNEPSKMEKSKELLTQEDARAKVQNFIRDMDDKARALLIEAGVCPDCNEVMEHHITEPFSSCKCGTSEDYGVRPLQAIQRLRYHLEKVQNVQEGFLDSERFEKFLEKHNEFLKIKNS